MRSKFRIKSITDLMSSVFPKRCIGCNSALAENNQMLCLNCLMSFPYFEKNIITNNKLQNLMSDLQIPNFDALMVYSQQSISKKIIHQLKYHGRKNISNFLGNLSIKKNEEFFKQNWDVVVGVPLHKNKMKKRGFNQLSGFLSIVENKTKIETTIDFLTRIKNTDSQTRLNREKRLKHLDNTFLVSNEFANRDYKKILLVDDVLTTGATTIACTEAIKKKYPNAEIGWFYLAVVV